MHGMSGGLMNVLGGGEFGSGFASGVVSSLISSVIEVRGKDFATKYPGAFKAIMITSGGLSGGFSSTIAGGKFVDGFRQGIITSGLNHLVHMIVNRLSLLSRFKKGNNGKYILNPYGKPNFSQDGITTINAAVDGLEEAFVLGGKPIVTFDEPTDVGSTDFGHVKLNPSKINNNLQYAAALFHEYRHAWQYFSGKFYEWQKKYPANWDYGIGGYWDLMERDAYWYQIQKGAGGYFEGYSRYEDYRLKTSYVKLPY